MIIDFSQIPSVKGPGMNHGSGEMSAQMFNSEGERIVMTRLHPYGSIGMHKQTSGDDINYVIAGQGKAICDGVEEILKPGLVHVCPQGSSHSIVNTGIDDLVLLTVVVNR